MNQPPPAGPVLSINDFPEFYEAVHNQPPFSWQIDLAKEVCENGWPSWIDLPTASGKTAVIDIAVFALAYQSSQAGSTKKLRAARRIFFTVDRRLIVNQAFDHGKNVSKRLWDAASGIADTQEILRITARALKACNGSPESAPPLDCFELRGGIFRDDAWVRSITQPTLIATTVDQIGSRLLFRGYGVSDRNLPIHAALTGNDSLVILDEAHCSTPFGETIECVKRYRGSDWSHQTLDTPFHFVRMTATPAKIVPEERVFRLTEEHYSASDLLRRRHDCSKPVQLVRDEKAKGKTQNTKLAATLVNQARSLAKEHNFRRIAIVVNRIAIAKQAFTLLRQAGEDADLMIGRMRPIDRDKMTPVMLDKFSSNARRELTTDTKPQFLVATQTIEVGADYDFDAMVCQCASLDALKQRFGRLNRLGNSSNCRGVIVAAEGDLQAEDKLDDLKPLDPIYHNSLTRTWNVLIELADEAGIIDFKVRGEGSLNSVDPNELKPCFAPTLHAPVLMPAHIDMLCQTMPKPVPELDIATYLHGAPPLGKKTSEPSVRVCWRSDLSLPAQLDDLDAAFYSNSTLSDWLAVAEACPPSTGECMTVPRRVLLKWLKAEEVIDDSSDVDGGWTELDDEYTNNHSIKASLARYGLVWRGSNQRANADGSMTVASFVVGPNFTNRLYENDTIILASEFGGWDYFGHIPGKEAPDDPANDWKGIREFLDRQAKSMAAPNGKPSDFSKIDIANEAFEQSRGKSIVRLHEKLPLDGIEKTFFTQMNGFLSNGEASLQVKQVYEIFSECFQGLNTRPTEVGEASRIDQLLSKCGSEGSVKRYPGGLVWVTKRHASKTGMPSLPSESFDDELDSRGSIGPTHLLQHLADVLDTLDRHIRLLNLNPMLIATLEDTARFHDLGKADPRFQANLLDKPLSLACMFPYLLAKSGGTGRSRHSVLPAGFRHEAMSSRLLDYVVARPEADLTLLRYLVESHHGNARPFMPSWVDDDPSEIDLSKLGGPIISKSIHQQWASETTLQSNCGERFWQQIGEHGAWGLAYFESLVRLSDWEASANPGQGGNDLMLSWKASVDSTLTTHSCVLVGIDASNPLAYLAAIGTFRILHGVDSNFRFSWLRHSGAWRPVVWSTIEQKVSEKTLIDIIFNALDSDADLHPVLKPIDLNESPRKRFLRVMMSSTLKERNNADWLTCDASDAGSLDAISQLQTSRRDYHAIGVRGLINSSTVAHLHRTLFAAWDYADPIAGLSLHLEPREDRRHAYQWHTPSGDPTRKSIGGMAGANRLALEAWPLFQSLPIGEKLVTVGFRGLKASNTKFRWPVWTSPVGLATVASLLSLPETQATVPDSGYLRRLGVPLIYQCSRILVGKTPNLTPATAMPCQ